MRYQILWVFMLNMLLSCGSTDDTKYSKEVISSFYEVYADRSNINQLMKYYAADVVFQDIMLGEYIHTKDSVQQFLDWSNPAFQKQSHKALQVFAISAEGRKIIVEGKFLPFKWLEEDYGPMLFTSIFELNADGLIIQQQDWINYPASLLDYSNRLDANEWY